MARAQQELIDRIARDIRADELPGDLPEIADLIGIKKALKLAFECGAGPIYYRRWTEKVSDWSSEITRMFKCIGMDDTRTILKTFNGVHIDIPRCKALRLKFRDIDIRDSANTEVYLSRMYDLSTRHIRNIRSAIPGEDRQMDFEL